MAAPAPAPKPYYVTSYASPLAYSAYSAYSPAASYAYPSVYSPYSLGYAGYGKNANFWDFREKKISILSLIFFFFWTAYDYAYPSYAVL